MRSLFPSGKSEPINYLRRCVRLDRNVLVDRFGKCCNAKEPVCDGCYAYNIKWRNRRNEPAV